jgi:hypothetical protein
MDTAERRPQAQHTTPSTVHPGEKMRTASFAPDQSRQATHSSQPGSGTATTAHDHRARKPEQSKKAEREKAKDGKHAPAAPKPRREPRQPTPPFTPTQEQIAAIERRYLELAQPAEFDGIRTQISKEFNIPKSAVKKVVRALREREDIPSWWDLQAYHGSPEDLERIRSVYVPLLPTPAVGIHKQIAAQLDLPAGTVYQAIKVIRADMNLPQYNPPESHEAQ